MRRSSILVGVITLSACGSDPSSPAGSVDTRIGNAAVLVPTDPTTPLIVGTSGGLTLVVNSDAGAGTVSRVTADANGESVTFVAAPDGTLDEVILGDGTSYLFTNYTATTVDVARIDPDGTVETAQGVARPTLPTALDPRWQLESADPTPRLEAGGTPATQASPDPAIARARDALIVAGVMVSTFSCATGVIFTKGVALIPCAGFIFNVIPRLLRASDEEWARSANSADVVFSYLACQSGEITACISFIVGLSEQILGKALEDQSAREEERTQAFAGLRFGGSWSYRTLASSYLVITTSRLDDFVWLPQSRCYSLWSAVVARRSATEYTYRSIEDGREIRAQISISADRQVLDIRRLNDNRLFVFDRVSLDTRQLQPRCPEGSGAHSHSPTTPEAGADHVISEAVGPSGPPRERQVPSVDRGR